jgi:RNA polymerase sigma-32 factor
MRVLAEKNNLPGTEASAPDQRETISETLALADPLQLYLLDVSRYGLLSREEEKALAIKVREENDEEAAHKLVTSNLRLVVKIAMDFQRYWTKNLMDLIQEGNLGLLHAVRKFDPYRGIKFSYYASFWIKAYMLKFLMDNWKLVKIGTTQNQRKLFFNLEKERRKMIAQGRDPEPKLLAERLDVKEKEVIEMSQRLGGYDISIDATLRQDSKTEYRDILPDSVRGIDERIFEKQKREIFAAEIKRFRQKLSGREADIFDNRIIAEDPETLQHLGNKHGISRERVRQVEERIVRNAKRLFEEKYPNFKEDPAATAGA